MARGKRIGIYETGEVFDTRKDLAKELKAAPSNLIPYIDKEPWHGLHLYSIPHETPKCIHCDINLTKNNWYESDEKKGCWICNICNTIRSKCYKKHISKQDLENLRKKQNNICLLCGDELDLTCHIDHKVSVKNGGKTEISNLQLLCKMCNIGKYSWLEKDYIEHCMKVAKYNLLAKED